MTTQAEQAAELQRERILRDHPDLEPLTYDLAVALGYDRESFDSLWLLRPDPFNIRWGHVVIAEAAVGLDGRGIMHPHDPDRFLTRYRVRPLPLGFTLVADQKLASTEITYRVVSPRMRASLP